MALIDEHIIKRIEKDNAKAGDKLFIVVAYDFPSEYRKGIDKETGDMYRSRRLSASRYIILNAVRLNDSVYIIHARRVPHILNRIEDSYKDMTKDINVKIVGNVYSDVAERIIRDCIEELLTSVKAELDEIEMKLEDYRDGDIDDDEMKTYKNKSYLIKHKMNCIAERVADLEVLNGVEANKCRERYGRLDSFRKDILQEVSKVMKVM